MGEFCLEEGHIADTVYLVLTRYCDDEFDPESSAATIGIDFKVRRTRPRYPSCLGCPIVDLSGRPFSRTRTCLVRC